MLGISKIKRVDLIYDDLLPGIDDIIPGIICKSPFLDDREVMLSACERRPQLIECASERLRSDHEFIDEILTRSMESKAIVYTTEEFRCENIDLVVKAINLLSDNLSHCRLVLTSIPSALWQHRSVILSCLNQNFNVLAFTNPDSPLRDDAELVRLAVEVSHTDLQFASPRLKGDREFILSLVKSNGRSLVHADAHLRNDDDVLLAAVADTPGAIMDCFGSGSNEDFRSVVSFASQVRSKLEQYDTFMRVFLSGISISRPHCPPSVRCHLPLLDQGIETSVAFKTLIARFVGVCMIEELQLLRKASTNLRKLGY